MPPQPTAPESTDLTGLLALLDSGALLLLPNPRAARNLRSAFDTHQLARNRTTWQPPSALAWTQWTSSLWSDLIVSGAEPRLLLNPAQEHLLWRDILSASPASTPSLTSLDALADLASSAFHLASAWNATSQLATSRLHTFASTSTPDTRIFAAWADTFTRHCGTHAFLSPALLNHALLQHLANRTLTPPAALHLVAFPDLTPSQHSLLEALRTHGAEVHHHTLQTSAPTHHASVIAPDPREELSLAARFTRSFLESHPTATSVALLVPNIDKEAPELESILRETLAPELQSIAADLSSTPWELASGPPLTAIPLIAIALDLARLTLGPIPLDRLSALVLSPYLAASTNTTNTAIFDTQVLRRSDSLRPELDLQSLLTLCKNSRYPSPTWPRNLNALLLRTGDLTRPRSFADCTELLRDLLAAAGWPGPRPLSATESAAITAWDSALDLIATLDVSGRRPTLATALDPLIRQLQTSILTPPSLPAQVQVLTPAEAAGSFFDAILFLRSTDANLPPAIRANPLLPWALQRSLAMPGTDPALDASRALALTSALLHSTPTALFTSAAEDADGHLRPSPLLALLGLQSAPAPSYLSILSAANEPAFSRSSPAQTPTIPLDLIPDTTPLPPLPSRKIKGGARVLQSQAACGFRAFAEFRLSSAGLDSSDLGFDAAESGNRVHLALQLFWQKIRTQDNLRNLPTPDRDHLLSGCIDEALTHHLHPQGSWDTAYLDSQKQRLLNLLNHWLDHELTRAPFEVLDAEHRLLLPIGPLDLEVRIDRIDQVGATPGGEPALFLVDYKTGISASTKLWDGDRPDEPQLPLYALTPSPEHLSGLAFARLRLGKDMKWQGLQSRDGIFPAARNSTKDLLPLLASWRSTLTSLAHDFAGGRALVDPKNYPTTCNFCAQRLLCRLDPASLRPSFSDSDSPDSPDSPEASDSSDVPEDADV